MGPAGRGVRRLVGGLVPVSEPAVSEPAVSEPAEPHPQNPNPQNPNPQNPFPGSPYADAPYANPPGSPYGPPGGWDRPTSWVGPAGPGGPGAGGPGAGGPGAGGPGGGPWAYGWQPAPPTPRRSVPVMVTALLLAVALLVGLGIGHGVWKATNASSSSSGSFGSNPFGSNGSTGSGGDGTGGSGSTGGGSTGGGSSSLGSGGSGTGGTGTGTGSSNLSAVVAAASDALVDINTTLSYQNDQAAGTGIVLTPNGYVLTNNHVISGATSISVTDIANKQTYTASVVGYDRVDDVALIKLQGASGLTTAKVGDSSKVSVGETVVGIGNAGGTGGTPSSAQGSITALGQSITAQDEGNGTSEQLTGLIQTDANIQPGDSGGALVDSSGQVVGMDTAASTGFSFQSQGNQGFAIPINTALAIGGKIQAGETSSKVHLGATAFLGVEVDTQSTTSSGAAISGVVQSGPAAQAGIAQGDVITSIQGATVDSPNTLTSLMSQYHPGDRITVGWTDSSGQAHQASVELANGPAA